MRRAATCLRGIRIQYAPRPSALAAEYDAVVWAEARHVRLEDARERWSMFGIRPTFASFRVMGPNHERRSVVAKYLVVANQTLGGDQLMYTVRQRVAAGPSSFFVLVPNNSSL